MNKAFGKKPMISGVSAQPNLRLLRFLLFLLQLLTVQYKAEYRTQFSPCYLIGNNFTAGETGEL